jgi:hypothetical protein
MLISSLIEMQKAFLTIETVHKLEPSTARQSLSASRADQTSPGLPLPARSLRDCPHSRSQEKLASVEALATGPEKAANRKSFWPAFFLSHNNHLRTPK